MENIFVHTARSGRGLAVALMIAALAVACAPAAVAPTGATSSTVTAAVSPAPPSATLPPPSATVAALTATPVPLRPTTTTTPALAEPTTDATALIGAVMTAQPARVVEAYDSPNKDWRVEVTRAGCVTVDSANGPTAYERLTLTDLLSGQSAQLIEDQLQYCEGLGAIGLGGLFWSADSRYFYYTNARDGSPDGGCLGWYRPATRLEPTTGEKVALVQGPAAPAGDWAAGFMETTLLVWNGQTGEIIHAPSAAEGQRAGAVAWAPDGHALVYLVWAADCVPAAGQVSLVRFDLASREQSLLLTGRQVAGFASAIWDAPNRVRLFTMDQHEWRFNMVTGTLSQFS